MEKIIRGMQENLREGSYVALVSVNEDNYFSLTKSDDIHFLDNKTLLIERKSGMHSIINLNLIVEICIKNELI